jgi:hypothetical protein
LLLTSPHHHHPPQVYIDNPVTRAVILKPVLQELQLTKLRMVSGSLSLLLLSDMFLPLPSLPPQGTVMSNCIDPGQPRRDLENLLRTITFAMSEFD